MITLSKGFKQPEDGEKGQVVFDAIELNFSLLNDHTHNGTNSAQIPSSGLSKGTLNVSSASWITVDNGFKQTITLPGVYTLANCTMRFRVRTGANINRFIHPTIDPISTTQFELVVNDSTLDLEILFI